jgi:hypothetical protein
MLQGVVAPIEQVFQNQHADHDLRRRTEAAAPSTVWPSSFERLGHNLNHSLVLEQRIDLAQPIGPQLVAVGQQNFEQTPLALSALNHARSFDQRSHAGKVVRQIDRRNRRMNHLITAGRRPSAQLNDLRDHFFTRSSQSTGVGSDIMKPIAALIIGGMVTSTIHVLIITLVIFFIIKRRAPGRGTLGSGMKI